MGKWIDRVWDSVAFWRTVAILSALAAFLQAISR